MPTRFMRAVLCNSIEMTDYYSDNTLYGLLSMLTHPANPAPDSVPTTEASSSSELRVLIVDDDDEVRSTVTDLLEGKVHVIGTAENGQRAIELAARFVPRYRRSRHLYASPRWNRALFLQRLAGTDQGFIECDTPRFLRPRFSPFSPPRVSPAMTRL